MPPIRYPQNTALLSRLNSLAGTVLLLEGPPHGGKTAILEAIQRLDQRVWFRMGIDLLCRSILPSLVGKNDVKQARNILDPATRHGLTALHIIIAAMARRGCDLVVDCLPLSGEGREEFQRMLEGLDVFRVRITCAENVIAQREAELGPKAEGTWAALKPAFALDVGDGHTYDFEIHGSGDPDAAARAILQALYARQMVQEPLARVAPQDFPYPRAEKPGRIVILCGTSSAGKSTLDREVQKLAAMEGITFLNYGIDQICYAIHPRFIGAGMTADAAGSNAMANPEGWIAWEHVCLQTEPEPILQDRVGPALRLGLSGQYAAIAALTGAGFDTIGDQVFYYRDWHEESSALWEGLPVLRVFVDADHDTLVAHEKSRGDRDLGIAVGGRLQMYRDVPYDLEINTTHQTPVQEAHTVMEKIRAM